MRAMLPLLDKRGNTFGTHMEMHLRKTGVNPHTLDSQDMIVAGFGGFSAKVYL